MVAESFISEKSWKCELVSQMSKLPPDNHGDLKRWPPEGVGAASEHGPRRVEYMVTHLVMRWRSVRK
jgi:hypothetical protein